MQPLDCNTERGQMFIERQREIVARCQAEWNAEAFLTPTTREAAVDVYFGRRGELHAIAEVKARDLSLEQLRSFGSYLITDAKLEKGRTIAEQSCVPFLLIVGLDDRHIVWWTVADATGRWLFDRDVRQSTTQATCNGGTANRVNAYLPLESMRVIRPPLTAADLRW